MNKFLTFFLDGEEYGLEILKVQEIIGLLPITRVPRTREYVRGVVNLRGRVIPILDLKSIFGMAATEPTSETCIVVVEVHGNQLGILVDRVSEVADIGDEDIEEAPEMGAGSHTDYLLGIAKSGGRVVLLLDLDRVLSMEEARAAAGGESTEPSPVPDVV